MEAIYVLLGLVAVAAIGLVLIYNGLVSKRQSCNQAFADIDVQLKQRQNLIPNLVETVKSYGKYEQETLDAVVQARQRAVDATDPADMAQAESALSGAPGKLFALAEAYPDLKASTNFLQLQDELSSVEDKLAAARRFFNSAVQDYNTAAEQFPGSIVAGMFGFVHREFFDVGDSRAQLSQAPKVDFG